MSCKQALAMMWNIPLTNAERVLLTALITLVENNQATATQSELARMVGTSRVRVNQRLKKLEAHGIISSKPAGRRGKCYTLEFAKGTSVPAAVTPNAESVTTAYTQQPVPTTVTPGAEHVTATDTPNGSRNTARQREVAGSVPTAVTHGAESVTVAITPNGDEAASERAFPAESVTAVGTPNEDGVASEHAPLTESVTTTDTPNAESVPATVTSGGSLYIPKGIYNIKGTTYPSEADQKGATHPTTVGNTTKVNTPTHKQLTAEIVQAWNLHSGVAVSAAYPRAGKVAKFLLGKPVRAGGQELKLPPAQVARAGDFTRFARWWANKFPNANLPISVQKVAQWWATWQAERQRERDALADLDFGTNPTWEMLVGRFNT